MVLGLAGDFTLGTMWGRAHEFRAFVPKNIKLLSSKNILRNILKLEGILNQKH